METLIEEKTYAFAQLSKEAKCTALSHFSDLNTDYDWWEFMYEDAERLGMKITGFNDYSIDTKLTESVYEICTRILAQHGESCDTYQLAIEYVPQFVAARLKGWNPDGEEHISQYLKKLEDCEDPADAIIWYEDEFEAEFKEKLEKIYLNDLNEEYEYRISDEAIIEGIEANEYQFDEEGNHV